MAYYIHTDHLTGSNVMTDELGSVAQVLDYYPFGSIRLDEKSGTFDEQRKFTGHEYDTDTQLSYMVARYYDGNVGRFVSQDPAFLEVGGSRFKDEIKDSIFAKPIFNQENSKNEEYNKELEPYLSNPQFLNSYSYTSNNPIRYTDKNGQATFDLGFGFTAGPAGLNIGLKIDPKRGWQLNYSNSLGLGFGFSVKYDPEGELDSRPRGEVYVERGWTLIPGIGRFKSTSANENPSNPFSLEGNPRESSGWGFGLEVGYSHAFVQSGDIKTFNNDNNTQKKKMDEKK